MKKQMGSNAMYVMCASTLFSNCKHILMVINIKYHLVIYKSTTIYKICKLLQYYDKIYIFAGSRHKKKLMRGNNKSFMVRKTLPYGLKNNRFMYLDKIEKNTVVLVYSLVLFAFACLTLLLTFAFHFFL